jgi:SAM-dependent methyltransferase
LIHLSVPKGSVMRLSDIINRPARPDPWSEGDNIPWNDPEFSRRMLREHLTQAHDHASRRSELIDAHVSWIHSHLLKDQPSRILDLGCGPGLYAQRLARMGHTCTGVDYGPASVAYARKTAEQEGLNCTFIFEDIRKADYGGGYDLVMQIYGELNVFRPADAGLILSKAYEALKPGGVLLLEVEDYPAAVRSGQASPGWFSSQSGLFSDQPYLYLGESFWDETVRAATERIYIIDAASGEVTLCTHSIQAYKDEEYVSLLENHGFSQVQFFPILTGDVNEKRQDYFPVVAKKK